MRVLWLTNDYPPRAGGIEQFVANLAARAVDADDTVVCAARHPEAARFDDTVSHRVVRIGARPLLPTPQLVRRVSSVAARHRPDVIVLGAAWPLGEVARALRHATGAPVVALTHGHEAGMAAVGLGALIGRATDGCAAVTAISDYTEQRLRPHVRAPRLRRVPPGVDTDAFHPQVDGREMRARWGVPDDAPVVGCIARLVRRKGQDVLLACWPQVARRHPDAWLVLVGAGPLGARVRHQATALGGLHVVAPGPVAWHELPAAHAALDVLAVPCRTRLGGLDVEGLGIVYLEAQASGRPVVVGRSGGAPEAVRDGETGVVVDGDDPAAVGSAVSDLLDDAALRARMGVAGRAWTEAEWAWPVIAGRFRAVLQEVTGEVSGSA